MYSTITINSFTVQMSEFNTLFILKLPEKREIRFQLKSKEKLENSRCLICGALNVKVLLFCFGSLCEKTPRKCQGTLVVFKTCRKKGPLIV